MKKATYWATAIWFAMLFLVFPKNVFAISTNDPYVSLQPYLTRLKIDQVWPLVVGGKSPLVAVIDDGVYINHPEFSNRIFRNKKEVIGNEKDDDKNGYVDDIYGWDFVSNEGEMTVRGSHGTQVAGIIAAGTNDSIGIAGINPSARIMPLIVCDASIGCPFEYVDKAIRYAVDNGATIINLSLGTSATTGYKTSLNSAVKYAYSKGVVIIAAAGNGDTEGGIGQNLDLIPQSPVCNDVGKDAIIGVGSVDDSDYLTYWSNYGEKCVNAYTPGVAIVSTAVPAYSTLGLFYDVSSGTSFSAPMVTGVVSLIRQKYPYMPNKELIRLVTSSYDAGGIFDPYSAITRKYSPPVITQIFPASVAKAKAIGVIEVTIVGKKFSKRMKIVAGEIPGVVKYVNSKKLLVTFDLAKIGYGKHLLTIEDSISKQRSIFRWLEIKH